MLLKINAATFIGWFASPAALRHRDGKLTQYMKCYYSGITSLLHFLLLTSKQAVKISKCHFPI